MVDEFYGVLLKHWRFKNQPATGEQSSEASDTPTIEIPAGDLEEDDLEIDLTDILESVKVEDGEDAQSDPYMQASLEDSAEPVGATAASEDVLPGAVAEQVSASISEADLVAAAVEPAAPKYELEAAEVVAMEPMAVEPVSVEPTGSCEKVDPLSPALPFQSADDKKTSAKNTFTALSDTDINSRIDMLKYIRLD